MIQRIHSTRTILALPIVAAIVMMSAGVPGLAQVEEKANETSQQADNEKNRKKIRKENDRELKAREPLYPQQAGSLAKHYKETAAIVARQGGDPQPLLDAAAYFEGQSKVP